MIIPTGHWQSGTIALRDACTSQVNDISSNSSFNAQFVSYADEWYMCAYNDCL
jgi:hypothetical protein